MVEISKVFQEPLPKPLVWCGTPIAALMLILLFGRTGLDLLPVIGLHDKDAVN